jgi:hypothetical protein
MILQYINGYCNPTFTQLGIPFTVLSKKANLFFKAMVNVLRSGTGANLCSLQNRVNAWYISSLETTASTVSLRVIFVVTNFFSPSSLCAFTSAGFFVCRVDAVLADGDGIAFSGAGTGEGTLTGSLAAGFAFSWRFILLTVALEAGSSALMTGE